MATQTSRTTWRVYQCPECGETIPLGTPLEGLRWLPEQREYAHRRHETEAQRPTMEAANENRQGEAQAPVAAPTHPPAPVPQPASALAVEVKPAETKPPETKPAEARPAEVTQTTLTPEQVRILQAAGRFPSDASRDEVAFGLALAERYGLDPWTGAIKYIRFRRGEPLTPYLGVDAMRIMAERSKVYDGCEIEVELMPKAEGSDPYEPQFPIKAVCRVYRKDWSRPRVEEVWFSEAVQYAADGRPTHPWRRMPVTMLRKAAEERALRAAFPEILTGLYGDAEVPAEDVND